MVSFYRTPTNRRRWALSPAISIICSKVFDRTREIGKSGDVADITKGNAPKLNVWVMYGIILYNPETE